MNTDMKNWKFSSISITGKVSCTMKACMFYVTRREEGFHFTCNAVSRFPSTSRKFLRTKKVNRTFLESGSAFCAPADTICVCSAANTVPVSVFTGTGIPVAGITLIGDIHKIHSLSRSPLFSGT